MVGVPKIFTNIATIMERQSFWSKPMIVFLEDTLTNTGTVCQIRYINISIIYESYIFVLRTGLMIFKTICSQNIGRIRNRTPVRPVPFVYTRIPIGLVVFEFAQFHVSHVNASIGSKSSRSYPKVNKYYRNY